MHVQLAVLGGGPGGYAAAFLAADLGMEVALIEQEDRLGGTCLLRGCIPSKALLHVAKVMHEVQELGEHWGVKYPTPEVNIDAVRARKDKVIETLTGGLKNLAKRRKVTRIIGRGTFENSTSLWIDGTDDSVPNDNRLTFDHCILATGSIPAMPPAFKLEGDRVMDSTGALNLVDIPQRMLVIGGGYIGLEMGSVYAQLGSEVSVVELMDGLVPGADRDLVKPLHKRLEKLFDGRIFLNTKVGSLGMRGDQVEVAFEGPGKYGREHYDRVLVAVGRRPNSRDIGLENTRVKVDKRGFVEVDKQQRTADPHILAIGDIAGEPMLAHKASHEGKVAVEALTDDTAVFDKVAIPAVIFTDPEIAWTGLTEQEAKQDGIEYETAIYPWQASGRAQALGITDGMTKWIIEPKTDRVLGCGIVGSGAGELIAEATLAVEMGAEVTDVVETIHAHPTLSETVAFAGEVHHGVATEIYKPRRAK